MKNGVKKEKRHIIVKIVWIAGAILTALMTVGTMMDFEYGINADSVCTCAQTILYFAAFIIGLFYLFDSEKDKCALMAAYVYALAVVLGFVFDVFCGSNYATLDMTEMVVNVVVFITFASAITILLKGKDSVIYSTCSKLWYLPSVVSMVIAFVNSINTEINDRHGFDISLVIVDLIYAFIVLVPMLMMTSTVKNIREKENASGE